MKRTTGDPRRPVNHSSTASCTKLKPKDKPTCASIASSRWGVCRVELPAAKWGTKESIHSSGTATVPWPKAWLLMKSVPNPAKMLIAGRCRERRLGQEEFAHYTFRPRPPSHHTVCEVVTICVDVVTKSHSETTTFLRGLCTSSTNQ